MATTAFPTCQALLSEFPDLFTQCIGDPSVLIRAIRAPELADEAAAVFCSNPGAIAAGLNSKAAVVVVPRKSATDAESRRGDKTILVSPNVERAMSTVIARFFQKTPYRDPSISGVHPTAVLHESVRLAPGVSIGPHAVVAAGVSLEKDVFIGANSVIEEGSEIGEGSVIHPLVYVGHHSRIGKSCEILPNSTIGKEGFGYSHDEKGNHYRIPHQGRVVLEDDVHIGAGCTIDRGTFGETRIGKGTKTDNQVHIAHNCRIGRNCLLTSGFVIAGSSRIGDNFVTGGGSSVTGHIEIGDNIQIAGLSGVSKSVQEPGQYGGYPLVPLKQHLKIRATLVHLPEMRKQLHRLIKKLMPELLSNDEGASDPTSENK